MSGGLLRALLLAASTGAIALGAFAVVASPYRARLPPPPPAPAMGGGVPAAPAADSLTRQAAARTPFRMARGPAAVPYDPERGAVEAAAPPAPPKPALSLSGIVWGAEPSAVVEGLPGSDGPRVLRGGDTVGALKVRRIAQQQVVITGMDTTWTLRVREPWR